MKALRDALAAALHRASVGCPDSDWPEPNVVHHERDSAAILADPAFREALVEAVAEASCPMQCEEWPTTNLHREGHTKQARFIVKQMLRDDDAEYRAAMKRGSPISVSAMAGVATAYGSAGGEAPLGGIEQFQDEDR